MKHIIINGCNLQMSLYYQIKLLFKYVKNPINSFLVFMGLKNSTKVILCNNLGEFIFVKNDKHLLGSILGIIDQVNLEDNNIKEHFKSYIEQVNNEIIEIDNIKFVNKEAEILQESFLGNPYDLIEFENRTVIDVGANIGDSTLVFANQNAKEIFAFEPVPPIYNIALENLELNPQLKEKIHIYNKAVSGEAGTIKIYFEKGSWGGANSFNETDEAYEIEAFTIEQILENYKVKPDVLKMDCEGCEYDIILNSDLSMFNDIIFEYHQATTKIPSENLIKKLEKEGFKVNKYPVFNLNIEDMGIMHAYK